MNNNINPNKGKALLPPLQPQPRPPLSDMQKRTIRHLDTYVEVVSAKLLEDVSKKQQQLSRMNNIVATAMMSGGGGKGGGGGGEKRHRDNQGNVDVVSRSIVYSFFVYVCMCLYVSAITMGDGSEREWKGGGGG
jgi:hypothetical protein